MIVLLAALQAPALAQPPAAPATPVDPAQSMYDEALRSIAEGRKGDASALLQRIIEEVPLHAGAWLELALLQCSLGSAKEAERLFTVIEQRFDPPPGIVQVIADARSNGCHRPTAFTQYTVTLSRGIDQNVNQGSTLDLSDHPDLSLSPEFRPQHDQYTMLSGEYLRELTQNGTLGFIQLQDRRNDTLSKFNNTALFFGVETPWSWGRWTARTTAMAGYMTLGSKFYQRQYQLQARVGPPVPLPYSLQFHVVGGISHTSYVTLQNFDATTTELRGQLSRQNGATSVVAGIGLQRDHAATDLRPGGDRRGLVANLSWRRRYEDGATTELAYSLQKWKGQSVYSAGILNETRDQATHVLRATMTWPLTRNQYLVVEGRQVINKENIPVFQYNNRQLQLSWQWQGL
ncbi:tetratricopeptide repeat protein [Duganella ginsengisoli]|uniref:Tetratricopeptide repeat protein n=1 Tax=Pseudoduganella ginsengisoli TaxID=1462440 RepID=A0A6L6PVZ7_9BURK|nr:tetratricopeptide repeat protein [Pseudoduganella ginsengisoli]